jgi:ABC-type polysaccharide/polyol phosphate transport system ATPase subunit
LGHTIIIVSHSPATIAEFCEHALFLQDGCATAYGSGEFVANAYLSVLAPNRGAEQQN